MTDLPAPPTFRLLAPRTTALGPGDFDALENVDTTILPNGALAYAADVDTFFLLHKFVVVAPNTVPGGTVSPASGPGQWVAVFGFEANLQFSYEIALDEGSGASLTTAGNWTAFPNTVHWNEDDVGITGAGLINGTTFWSSASPGSGVLTYHGPTRFFDASADVSVSHSSGADEPVFGLAISKNGAFIGAAGDLLREQQASQVAAAVGQPEHIHTSSRLVMQAGDTLQIVLIDRGTAQTMTVARAILMVSPS